MATYNPDFTVDAFPILSVRRQGGGTGVGLITVDGETPTIVTVPLTFMRKYKPQAGGWLIEYSTGGMEYLDDATFVARFEEDEE